MTIKDLMFIHSLLMEEAIKRENAKNLLKELVYQAEENKAENYKELKKEYEIAKENYNKAYNVLQNFKAEEWK